VSVQTTKIKQIKQLLNGMKLCNFWLRIWLHLTRQMIIIIQCPKDQSQSMTIAQLLTLNREVVCW